ncbi:MAG: ABC transporter permease [Bryobacteraceae bacterium]|nr:ABC transporter permease [Bryobacteraceae bacterium]
MRRDLSYALRNMTRNPALFALAALTLAIGIGANTAMFSVTHAVLLRPLPYRDADRLVTIRAGIPRLNISGAFVEYNTFVDWWRARAGSFDAMTAFSPGTANLTSGDQPQRVRMLRVSDGFFPLLGVRPALGRDFLPGEDRPGAPRVAIISDGLWKRRFGGDPAVAGRSIVLDRASYEVVGVLPPDFDLHREDVFTPIAHSGARAPGMPTVGVYGRRKPGVALATAQAEIDSLCRGWVEQYGYPPDWGARVWPLRAFLVRDVRSSVVVLGAAVTLVLLIACANIAALLLARAGARQREMAVRTAVGAPRSRLVRQLLTESAVLGAVAAALGLALAWASVRTLAGLEMPFPFLDRVTLNTSVLCFAAGATLLTTILFGLVPALSATRSGLAGSLGEAGRGGSESLRRSRARSALVVGEVAIALLLTIGATLTVRSLTRLLAVDPGFQPEGVLTAEITLPPSSYPKPSQRMNFFNALLERMKASPGVKDAGMGSHLPFSGSKSGNDVSAEGAAPRSGERNIAFMRAIDPGYFGAIGVSLIEGRSFTPRDPAGSPVAIINETMARRCWPGESAVGRRFAVGRGDVRMTVVGVTRDVRSTSLADEPDAEYFVPYAQTPGETMALVVRTTGAAETLASTLRNAIRELDKDLPVSDVAALETAVSRSTFVRRFSVTLLAAFALVALLLATIGIYGVVSYSVARRTREIGVRMALGAGRGRIAARVVGQAALLGLAGIAIGLAGSLALTRALRGMLYGVSPTDPTLFAAASLFLLAVAALAAYLPARRAACVDPVTALRHE